VTYDNNSNTPTTSPVRTIQVIVNDGADDGNTAVANVTVVANNDPPVNTVPAATQVISEDTPLTFTAGTATEISISDADAGTGAVSVVLTATNGALTLSGTAGLSGVSGNGTGNLSATGRVSNINNALNGLVFSPTLNFNGTTTVVITVDDNGNTGGSAQTDTDTINITVSAVNDPPAFSSVAGSITYASFTPPVILAASGVISDPDAANFNTGVFTVTITSPAGVTDTLSVVPGGNFIEVAGSSVRHNPPGPGNRVTFGQIDGTFNGQNGVALRITLDADATTVEVQALLRQIAITAAGQPPSSITRVVEFAMTDNLGAASNRPQVNVQ
jgi:hypothetical protein